MDYYKIPDEQLEQNLNDVLKMTGNSSSQHDAKLPVKCSSCHAPNSIRNNKVEIDIGDEQGSVASVQFEYCDKCGWRGSVEWFD